MGSKHYFSDELERQFQIQTHMDTFQYLQMLLARGIPKPDAYSYIQGEMDDIWKAYRKKDEGGAFHSMDANDFCPFPTV